MHDERIRYQINQLTETGANVSLALSEDIELEPVSQQQMMLEAVERAVTDKDVKAQIRPILEAILKSQPQTLVKTYSRTVVQITMPMMLCGRNCLLSQSARLELLVLLLLSVIITVTSTGFFT